MEEGGDGRLEAVTLESEISMSVVTNQTQLRRRRFFDRFSRRGDDADQEEEAQSRCLNVEPVVFFISLALGIQMTSSSLFTYWARCIELAYELHGPDSNATSLCAYLSAINNTEFQDIVEKDIASTRIYLQLVSTIPTLFMAPIIGNWSDHHGRRRPLILALCGMVMNGILTLSATLTYQRTSIYVWMFASEILFGVVGGMATVFASIMSIVTDDSRATLNSGTSEIPLRVAAASSIQALGSMLGALIVTMISTPANVSIELHTKSYETAASWYVLLSATALTYAIFMVRETHRPRKELFLQEEYPDDAEDMTYITTERVAPRGIAERIRHHVCPLVQVLTQPREGFVRLCLNLSLMFIFVEFLALDAQLLFLYVKRQPFAWSDKMFSFVNFLRSAAFAVGMFVLPMLMRYVPVLGKDSILIGLGVTASSIGFFIIAFAKTSIEIIASVGLSVFSGAISPAYRSFLPRMVPKEQTARLFTITSIIMSTCPILSALIFNNMFNWSLSFWPGFSFLVGGLFQLLVVFGQIIIHFLMRPHWREQEEIRERHAILESDQDESDDVDDREARTKRTSARTIPDEDDDRSVSNTAIGSDYQSNIDDRRPLIT